MSYIGPSIETGFRQRYVYTATAGQTSFSGNDSVGISLTYTDSEYLDVYQNGVLLVPGSDYAATTGTTVVLVTGASLNDKVEMIAYQAFGVADTVSRADGGAFGGAVSMASTLTVTDDANFDSGTLFVDASTDRVGMGTSSPQVALHVEAASASGKLRLSKGTVSSADDGIGTIQFRTGNTTAAANINGRTDASSSGNGALQFQTGTTSSVSEAMRITSSGEITKPLQPAFQARPASEQTNLPINAYTQIVFGTEVFDIGSNFASNVFTAPVAGKYALHLSLRVDNMDIDTTYYDFRIVTSNRDYKFFQGMAQFDADGYSHAITLSCVADMDASDTAQVKVDIPNAGAAVADVNANSFFSGMLIG